MTIPVQHRLFELIQAKENQLHRRITMTEVAEGSNVSIRLVSRWLDLATPQSRFDAHAIAGFCRYFNCEIGDLLYIVPAEDE
jgi:DNA-binding Xre family transcriptional regulator